MTELFPETDTSALSESASESNFEPEMAGEIAPESSPGDQNPASAQSESGIAEEIEPDTTPTEVEILRRTFPGRLRLAFRNILRASGSFMLEALEVILPAILLTLVINTVTGRYQVQSVSMEPTLHEGQYLIASKISYLLHEPERGDIIVLNPPEGQPVDPNALVIPYIKRVIGVPGDRIDVHDGRVWVNDVALNEPYISGPPSYVGNWLVGPDEYFVLGDNRNNSSDSHIWGMLARKEILGKAVFRYWPFNKMGPLQHYTYPELEEATHGTN